MKKIGEGWQHTVYDIGNGRVYKKYKSFLSRFLHIYFHPSISFFEAITESKRMTTEVSKSFEIIRQNKIPPEWLGNPELLTNFDYTQDKVIPLGKILNEHDTKRAKEIIDSFIEFNKKILEFGFIDLSFKIAVNFGLTAGGGIILTDIGEVVVDPERIIRQRKEHDWHSDYVKNHIKNDEIRKYYQDQMDEHFGL